MSNKNNKLSSRIQQRIQQIFRGSFQKPSSLLDESYLELPDVRFLHKYRGKKRIYVRFSEVEPRFKTLIRGKSVSHRDPSGIYAFPVNYVLDNYMNQNVNVFFSMPFIIILEDKSVNKFIVGKERTLGECSEIAKKMGFSFKKHLKALLQISTTENDKEKIQRLISSKSTKTLVDPFIFFSSTQVDEVGNIVSSDVQRMRWLKAGYDAIEDIGSGVINIEEPYQIIFLKENSCEIIDSYDKRNLLKKVEKSPFNALVDKGGQETIDDYADRLDADKSLIRFSQEVSNKLIALILKEALFDDVSHISSPKITSVVNNQNTKQQNINFIQRGFGKKIIVHLNGKMIGMKLQSIQLIIVLSRIETPKKPWKEYRFVLDKRTTIDDIVQHIYDDVGEEIDN